MLKSIIKYKDGKFWYKEGIGEKPESINHYKAWLLLNIKDDSERVNKLRTHIRMYEYWQAKFDSQEGWIEVGENDFDRLYLRMRVRQDRSLKENDFIYINSSKVEVKNGKAYLK